MLKNNLAVDLKVTQEHLGTSRDTICSCSENRKTVPARRFDKACEDNNKNRIREFYKEDCRFAIFLKQILQGSNYVRNLPYFNHDTGSEIKKWEFYF